LHLKLVVLSSLHVGSVKRPEIRGDFDNWDEKFKDDPDWISGDGVPGKMKMDAAQLQAQSRALEMPWSPSGHLSQVVTAGDEDAIRENGTTLDVERDAVNVFAASLFVVGVVLATQVLQRGV
jgi:hypothetical protein